MKSWQKALAAALAVANLVVGLWSGEDVASVVNVPGLSVALVISAVVAILAPPMPSTGGRVLGALMVLTASAMGFVGGRYQATVAVHEAGGRGEEVREALAAYHEAHGAWPETLEALPFEHGLPGKRLLHGTVLTYVHTETGYVLTARDWAVQWTATETTPFALTGREP